MEPLKGASWGRGGPDSAELGAASRVGVGTCAGGAARADCMPSTCCGVTAGCWYT